MVVFGGGNEGIVDELHVYNTGKINIIATTLTGCICYCLRQTLRAKCIAK